MIVEYVRYEANAEQVEALIAAYRKASKHLDDAPECVGYEVAQGIEAPGNVVVRIEWRSVEEHERGFRGGPHFPPFLALVRPFIGMIREMKHYRPLTPARSEGGERE